MRLLAAAFVLLAALRPDAGAQAEPDLVARARAIHDRVIALDTHNDIEPSRFTPTCNYTMRLTTQVNLPKMKEGGLDVSFMVVYVGQPSPAQTPDAFQPSGYERAYREAVAKFDAVHALTEQIAPTEIALALTPADVLRIANSGKKVAVIGIENGYPIGTDIRRVKEFWDRGGRYMSLAHNGHSQLADSNTGEANNQWMWGGLSPARQASHRRAEPVGDHGRRLPSVKRRDHAGDGVVESPRDRIAFRRAEARERQPQHGRRDADGAEDQRRRDSDRWLRQLPQGQPAGAWCGDHRATERIRRGVHRRPRHASADTGDPAVSGRKTWSTDRARADDYCQPGRSHRRAAVQYDRRMAEIDAGGRRRPARRSRISSTTSTTRSN